ncbi:MAG: molybdopterin-binding protein [Myxococcales bacterium]
MRKRGRNIHKFRVVIAHGWRRIHGRQRPTSTGLDAGGKRSDQSARGPSLTVRKVPGYTARMGQFLEAVTPDEARRILARFGPIARTERVGLAHARGRVLGADAKAPEPLPAFDRALMDGYAVRAQETFGAAETSPAYLSLAGRISMGVPPTGPLPEGASFEISTGGAMPEGADAVAMIEHCRETGSGQVEVGKAVAPLENVLKAGEDVAAGSLLVAKGRRLRPQDVLALAAVGVDAVEVYRSPRVAVLSTGDELVPADRKPGPGQVRDANGWALAAQIEDAGAIPVLLGICRDEPERLESAIRDALAKADAVFVSGGSSQGARDSTADVLARFGPPGVMAHGIAVAPGKPTILAAAGEKPLIGLPGHPVSSLVIARLFMNPLLRALGGETGPREPFVGRAKARLSRSVASKPGREDWVRVALRDGVAEPLLKGSGAISTALRADGLVCIPLDAEGLAAGSEVEVALL